MKFLLYFCKKVFQYMYTENNNYEYRPQGFNILPLVCKNILIINVLLFLLSVVLEMRGIDLTNVFGLHFFPTKSFHFWQIITYSLFHGNFSHLFFNMFAIWMFGSVLENIWGSKRFLIYCIVTAIGAAIMQEITYYFMYKDILNGVYDGVRLIGKGTETLVSNEAYLNHINCIGASGICFGLLLAFGMMFPNNYIYLYFLVPIKTKYFVVGYMLLELFNGVLGTSDGVAHFAHLGGALAGLFLVLYWRKKAQRYF